MSDLHSDGDIDQSFGSTPATPRNMNQAPAGQLPLPPSPGSPMRWPPPPPPPNAPRSRRRTGWIISLVLGGLAVLVAGGVLLVVAVDRTALTHDLLTTHFDRTAVPFQTGSQDGYRYSLDNGTYRITVADGSVAAQTGSFGGTYGRFARRAYTAYTTAQVASLRSSAGAQIGVACSAGSGQATRGYGAMLTDGRVEIMVVHPDGTSTQLASRTISTPLGEIRSIELRCSTTNPLGAGVRVTVLANGSPLAQVTDPQGTSGWDGAALFLHSHTTGDQAAFSSVTARVPGG